jgi:hypothetical protein
MGFTDEMREKVWGERKGCTSLHRTFFHTSEVWTYDIQIGVTTILGRSSCHLPRVATEEVFESTRGYSTVRSDTARSKLDLSRAPYQDFGSEGSCQQTQDHKVLQGAMEQPFRRKAT